MSVIGDIFNFVSSLSKTITAAKVREDLESLKKEINENLLPLHTSAVSQLKGKPFNSEWGRMLEEESYKVLTNRRGSGYLETTRKVFVNVSSNLKIIESLVIEHFSKDIPKEGMNFIQGNIIQFLKNARFITRYSIQNLNRVLANEICHLVKAPEKVDDFLTPAEKKWMASNFKTYFQVLHALDIPPSEFSRKFETIPNVSVSDNKLAMGIHGRHKLEPFRTNFVFNPNMLGAFNIIYHLRQGWAEWQVENLMRMKEEKKTIELRLLRLKELQQGKNNPKLEQVIEYNEGRLQRLNATIAELEEKYAGGEE